jgi:co-chaperonin GroES (HSP10)
MPQAPERLRRKFMTATDDGVQRCVNILKEAGAKIDKGVIRFPPEFIPNPEVADAADFLCMEWDYAIGTLPSAVADRICHDDIDKRIGKLEMRLKDAPSNPGHPNNGTSLKQYESLDYKPLWDFILCLPLARKKTKGGIVLPDNSKGLDDTRRCLVIKAGPGTYNGSGAFIPNPISVGQYIFNMVRHLQPYKVVLEGKLYLCMPSSEVLAVGEGPGGDWEVSEITEEEAVE